MLMNKLREGAGGWIAKIFLALLIISFGIWGIADVFRGAGTRDVATIGATKIDAEDFRRVYTERLQTLSRQLGRGISSEQARALGFDRQILGEMLAEAAFDEKARNLRLNVDNATLARRIQDNPAFRGPAGTFDPAYYRQVLQQNGFSEARYEDSERRLLLRQQIARALGGDAIAPAALREAARRFELEERAAELVTLNRGDAGEIPAPTPEQLAAYFEANKALFRAPEYRKISYLALTPEALLPWVQISDEDLRKAYEQHKDRFAVPEKRELEQIVFPTMAEAEAVATRLKNGEKFEAVVAERKLAPKDVALGIVARSELLDPAVASAAFSLALGAVSGPVAGRFGAVIVRVLKIVPGQEKSFAEVAGALRQELAVERARNQLLDLHDKVEDERASGATIAETARKVGLNATAIDAIDRTGREPDGALVQNLPGRDQLLSGAFTTAPGVEAPPIELRAPRGISGYVWYEVLGVTPSRDRTLDEAKVQVEARWRDEEIGKRLAERAEAIRAKLEAGEPFATAAAGLKVETRDKLRRNGNAPGLDSRVIARMFEAKEGKPAVATAEDGTGRVVFRVTSVKMPPTGTVSAQVETLLKGISDDLVTLYLVRLQSELGAQINEAALRLVIGAERN